MVCWIVCRRGCGDIEYMKYLVVGDSGCNWGILVWSEF